MLNMNETILVTGATGTVGSEIVKQLSRDASSYNIKAGVHSIENAKRVQQYDRVKAVQIDYDIQEGLETAFRGADKLFLHTPPPNLQNMSLIWFLKQRNLELSTL